MKDTLFVKNIHLDILNKMRNSFIIKSRAATCMRKKVESYMKYSYWIGASKKQRIIRTLIFTIVLAGISVYNTLHPSYEQLKIDLQFHPVAAILGGIASAVIYAPIIYWLTGWYSRRKEEKAKQMVDVSSLQQNSMPQINGKKRKRFLLVTALGLFTSYVVLCIFTLPYNTRVGIVILTLTVLIAVASFVIILLPLLPSARRRLLKSLRTRHQRICFVLLYLTSAWFLLQTAISFYSPSYEVSFTSLYIVIFLFMAFLVGTIWGQKVIDGFRMAMHFLQKGIDWMQNG